LNGKKELLSMEVSIYRCMTVMDLKTLTNDCIVTSKIFTVAIDEESAEDQHVGQG
jgi:hypothetical protein